MKKYLLLQAETGSEWDTCAFALIEINDERIEHYKKLQAFLEKGKKLGVNEVQVWCSEAEFFADQDQLPEECINEESQEIREGIYEFTDEFIDTLSRPDNRISYEHIAVTQWSLQFCGSGKHTGEQFWAETTIEFIIDKMIKRV